MPQWVLGFPGVPNRRGSWVEGKIAFPVEYQYIDAQGVVQTTNFNDQGWTYNTTTFDKEVFNPQYYDTFEVDALLHMYITTLFNLTFSQDRGVPLPQQITTTGFLVGPGLGDVGVA